MARELTITWEDPAALAEDARAMVGIEFLRAIRDGELSTAPIQELLGFSLVEVDEGARGVRRRPRRAALRGLRAPTAATRPTPPDSTWGCVHSTLPAGSGYSTLETKFNLVRAITADTGEIRAEGKVVHRGGRVATAEGRITREADGKLLAHGTSTCLILGG